MDENGSRTIDREELENGLNDFGLSMTRMSIDQLFQQLDRTRSGQISFDEFLENLRVSSRLLANYQFEDLYMYRSRGSVRIPCRIMLL